MTIAISLKVNDGVVLAADSATTLQGRDEQTGTTGVVNIYNNANKVFNLLKETPIGAITWGSGSIGAASISTLMKDLRRRFAGLSSEHHDWKIDTGNYTVLEVATRVRRYMFEELYVPAFSDWPNDKKPALGFIVAGYSSDSGMAEEYQVNIAKGACAEAPVPLRQRQESGLSWSGQPEAITRLVMGLGTAMGEVLQHNLGVPVDEVQAALDVMSSSLEVPLVMPAMPIQDAIDLARFLVETTVGFYRFAPGAPSVGGPIEIAAITKHEGFKWVSRKHYFTRDLNVGERYV